MPALEWYGFIGHVGVCLRYIQVYGVCRLVTLWQAIETTGNVGLGRL